VDAISTASAPSSPAVGRSAAVSRSSAPATVASRNSETPSRTTRRSNQKSKARKTPVASKSKASRPSTGKKKKSAAGFVKCNDYHYGSDFEESDKSEYITESEQSDTNVEDVDDVSDSDFSVGGFSVGSRARKNNISYIRIPSPEPLWLRDEEIPKLELPKSSEDLLVPIENVMQALCVYEVLRRFKSQVNLHC